MKFVASALTAVAAVFVLTPPAQAKPDRADCKRKLERTYSKFWHKVRHVHDKRAPGRNIRRDGVRFRGTTFDATCGELRRSRRQLKKLLVSPPYSHSRAVPPAQPPAGVRSDETVSNGGSSNPMVNPACESGGDPQIVSANGLYWGWYQFDKQTWIAHGGSEASYGNAPLYVQHQVAARVKYDAWPNC